VIAVALLLSPFVQKSYSATTNQEQRIAALQQKPTPEGEAVRRLRKAAEQGEAASESALGEMYVKGLWVPRNYGKALKWLLKSAEQGDARGEFDLAVMYAEGDGVPQDDVEAAKWLRNSADQGFAPAQFGLGVLYEYGKGVPHDDAKAVRLYRAAMDSGNVNAVNNLALILATSSDIHVRNPDEAVAIALKAIEEGGCDPTYLDTLANAYYEAGQYDKAVETERQVLSLNPANRSYQEALEKYLGTISRWDTLAKSDSYNCICTCEHLAP
jgi:TPR repeat protein